MNDSIKQDAKEFGQHVRMGGWRLGLLVARNVKPGTGGPRTGTNTPVSKITARQFAEEANIGIPKGTKTRPNLDRISHERVIAYLTGWETAAEAGHVPHAADLAPTEEPSIDWASLPEWGDFYPPITGGYNGGKDRVPTAKQAAAVIAALPAAEAAAVIAAALDTDEVIEAVKANDDAVDHVFGAAMRLGPERGKTKKAKPNRGLSEMLVTLELMGVLGKIRDLAKEDSDSPLIKECKNLMRETLEILDRIEEADDPEMVEQMFTDFGDLLSSQ